MKVKFNRTKKVVAAFLAALILLFFAFVGWVWFSTFHPAQVQSVPVKTDQSAPSISENREIKVLNWNLQFMAGKGYYFYYEGGTDTRPSSEDIEQTTAEVARVIKTEDPDIILLQELDDGAKRTNHEDQLEKLLDLLPDEYRSHASAFYWKASFSPHPKIMGSVGMKLSLISKYRMKSAVRHQLPLKPDNWFVRQFDLKRSVLEVRFPRRKGKDLLVFNTHLTAFAFGSDVRTRQVSEIHSLLKERSRAGNPWIIGGDFNLRPPGREVENQQAGVIKPLFDDYKVVPGYEEVNGPNLEDWYTHFPNDPAINAPDKTIDYLFLSKNTSLGAHYVRRRNTLDISDHLPVIAEIGLS